MAEFVTFGSQLGLNVSNPLPCLNGGRASYRPHYHGFRHWLVGFACAFYFHALGSIAPEGCVYYTILKVATFHLVGAGLNRKDMQLFEL